MKDRAHQLRPHRLGQILHNRHDDGIAELWFDSITDMVAAFNEPKFMEKIAPDDEKFVDAVDTQLFTLREIEKFPIQTNMY